MSLPDGWVQRFDPNQNRNYYVDLANKQTTWNDPRQQENGQLQPKQEIVDATPVDIQYQQSEATQKQQIVNPIPVPQKDIFIGDDQIKKPIVNVIPVPQKDIDQFTKQQIINTVPGVQYEKSKGIQQPIFDANPIGGQYQQSKGIQQQVPAGN
ncbi:17045_t:CDS:2, partial [Cetraspora pellucida]